MKTKAEIVETLGKEKKVEQLLKNILKGDKDIETDDLAQDIYLELLAKPEGLIQELNEKEELAFYIVRMITNNVFSKNSPYYYRYEKYNKKRTPIDKKLINLKGDD